MDEMEVEIFRAGDYGDKGTWGERELEAIAADYDPALHEAPVTMDHAQSGPALGWVASVRKVGDRLVARLRKLNDRLLDLVRQGAFKKRSVELYPSFEETGRPYLRAVSFLGAAAPEVKGLADPTPQPWRVEEELDQQNILPSLSPVRIHEPRNTLPPDSVELIGQATGFSSGRASLQFPPERAGHGEIPRRFTLDWLDLGGTTAAGDLGELYWAWLGESPFVCGRDFSLGAAMLSAGDTIRLTDETIEMIETLAWVSRVESGPGARTRLTVTGPWAGDYVWRWDLENYIRRYAFGGQMVFVVGGHPVARLSREGTFRLAGSAREECPIAGGPFTEPIALEDGLLVFGLPVGGLYEPFMTIDGSGRLTLDGILRERSGGFTNPDGASMASLCDRLWLSSDGLSGNLEFVGLERRLHLKGILIEDVRL